MRTAATDGMDRLDPPVGPEAAVAMISAPASVVGVRPNPSRAVTTRRYYAADWAAFQAWCRAEACQALPAAPASVAAYLAAEAAKLRPGTLRRRLAAIADQHRQLGYPAPLDAEVRNILRQVRRCALPNVPLPSAAPLARMAAACPGDLTGVRDRALLSLAAATGLGRAALVGLDVEDLRFDAAGVGLAIQGLDVAPSTTGRVVAVAHALPLAACPVHALAEWLRISCTSFGPVFRKIDCWGNVEHRRLGPDALRRIWQHRALPAERT